MPLVPHAGTVIVCYLPDIAEASPVSSAALRADLMGIPRGGPPHAVEPGNQPFELLARQGNPSPPGARGDPTT